MKNSKFVPVCSILVLAILSIAATKSASKESNSGAPDKAHLQKIWDGWSTLNPDNVAQFYASGPHTFFDIAPLKYTSWQEYQTGVRKELADYKGAKFTVNDDAELHPAGNYVWGTATVKFEMTHQNGKVDMGNMRWTVVFEKQGGKWMIVHEHVSMPIG
jgi:ketosteroid isomerase-like protein